MITSKNLKQLKLDAIAAAIEEMKLSAIAATIDSVKLMEGAGSCTTLYDSYYEECCKQDKKNAHTESREFIAEYREHSGAYSDRIGFSEYSYQNWENLSLEEKYSFRLMKLKAFYYHICTTE